ncbi:MAG: hypothetical protein JXA57_05955, partial [Armatimonadetes bacterium]|nr:hypothetical protein [Armatimonadota bacterium]
MKWLLSVSLIALAIAVAGPSAASSDDVPDWLAPSLADSESAQDPTEDGSPPSDVERDSQAEETEELAPPPELADEDLGVLDAVEASAEFEVPDSRLWHAPQG